MNDLRLELAVEVCEQNGYQLFAGRCEVCNFPLVEQPHKLLPFCYYCNNDRVTALLAHETLLKMKLAAKGIRFETHRDITPQSPEAYEPQGVFRFGMPL